MLPQQLFLKLVLVYLVIIIMIRRQLFLNLGVFDITIIIRQFFIIVMIYMSKLNINLATTLPIQITLVVNR